MTFEINPFESNPGWDIVKAFYNYYGLKDYVSFLYSDYFRPNSILEIEAYDFDNKPGDGKFWKEVLSGGILKGQKIRLLNFQISPWFPRKPGLFWTYNAAAARDQAMRNHIEKKSGNGIVLDVYGKTLMTELGGIGAINFNKDREYSLITATASGNTEEGIPIICRKNVWEKINTEFQKGNKIEVDLEGYLVNLSSESNSYFLRSGVVPRVAILVNSLLNIEIKSSKLLINVTPWTIFQTKDEIRPYGFTFYNHYLFYDDIIESKQWIENYVQNHKGKTILTDFDENLNHLNAIFPLNDITNGAILNTDIMEYSQKIIREFKR